MHEQEHVKLLRKYHTPRFKYGTTVNCTIRGPVKIVGLTDAPIPWPKCRSGKRSRAIILYGALAKAVKRESARAVAYWFGVGRFTVCMWRKALGVGRYTEGTSALLSRMAPKTCQSIEANRKRAPSLRSPERAAKIGAAKRGIPTPDHVKEAIARANRGRKSTQQTRLKMSEAHKRRGTIPPAMRGPRWTVEDHALLGTMKDKDVADRIGRPLGAVQARRYVFGIPNILKRKPISKPPRWTPERDRLLGTMPDTVLARQLRCSPYSVFFRRKKLKISRYRGPLGPRR
jgi:hypothetical protein